MEDQFDNVGIIMTNSKKEINLNLMDNSWKKTYEEVYENNDQKDNFKDDTFVIYKYQYIWKLIINKTTKIQIKYPILLLLYLFLRLSSLLI